MVMLRCSPKRILRLVAFSILISLVPVFAAAQHGSSAAAEPARAAQHAAEGTPSGINEEFGKPLAAESREAAAEKENEQEKMVQEMKESPSVRWMASLLHISPRAAYWLGVLLDFAVLALVLIYLLKKTLPGVFRGRTANIRRGIEEAAKASAEANQRLAQVEARLARLDEEIGAIRAAAEKEIAEEEQRIHVAAEQDRKRIVQAAAGEIEAAVKLARSDLKTFAADLAVALAERRIRVDSATDEALVRSFTGQLGRSSGKDGQ